MEAFDDQLAGTQLIRQPEADRKKTRIHQLMDLHPDLALTAQHDDSDWR
jgi:hypothetical protein